jgi:hypothetical protein
VWQSVKLGTARKKGGRAPKGRIRRSFQTQAEPEESHQNQSHGNGNGRNQRDEKRDGKRKNQKRDGRETKRRGSGSDGRHPKPERTKPTAKKRQREPHDGQGEWQR